MGKLGATRVPRRRVRRTPAAGCVLMHAHHRKEGYYNGIMSFFIITCLASEKCTHRAVLPDGLTRPHESRRGCGQATAGSDEGTLRPVILQDQKKNILRLLKTGMDVSHAGQPKGYWSFAQLCWRYFRSKESMSLPGRRVHVGKRRSSPLRTEARTCVTKLQHRTSRP